MTKKSNPVVIGVPLGDPSGIGPEIAVKATLKLLGQNLIPLLIGDQWLVEKAMALDSPDFQAKVNVLESFSATSIVPGRINVLNVAHLKPEQFTPGVLSVDSGKASLHYTELAVGLALAGGIDGIACAPANKEAMRAAGSKFSGQTELIASLTGASEIITVLVSGPFRVFQMTGHLALRKVCDLISEELVLHNIRKVKSALKDFGVIDPLIAVCGLNPHSGDGGLMGDEELKQIIPAIKKARAEGIKVDGPFPGDTVFLTVKREKHDGVLALYHDQANAVLKYISEPVSVNIGLPIVRTTVGHGTAFDIAWKGKADPACMTAAIKVAGELAGVRKGGNFTNVR